MKHPVLLVIHSLGQGGSERQAAAIACALDWNRFEPHVMTVKGGFRVKDLEAAGVPVNDLPLRTYIGPSVIGAAWHIRKYIRDRNIQLVHGFDYAVSPVAMMAARWSGVVGLSSQRFLMDTVPPKYRYLQLAAHWIADGVVANSDAAARHLHDIYKYPGRRIFVCHNGLDPEQFPYEPRERVPEVAEAKLVVGCVCVFRKEKNLGQLIDAFARVREPGLKLLLAGGGPEESALRAQAAAAGLGSDCVFLPMTPQVNRILRSIDIFVHPSLSEGLPNAIMEAMASGCTVIASRVGGSVELIDDGVDGFLVRPADLNDLTERLRSVMIAPEERMGVRAASRIRRDFSIAASANRMGEIYKSFLNR